MARVKRFKAQCSQIVTDKLESIHKELQSRGASGFDVNEIITTLIQSNGAEKVINKFVSANTPDDYKLNHLLKTPGEREKLIGLLNEKDFGFEVKAPDSDESDQPQL